MKSSKVLWCAAAILAVSGQAHAVDKSWNLGFGSWNTGANWLAPGVPGVLDNVFLGNTAIAENAFVSLNVNSTVASMTITDGMALTTDNARMVVNGDTLISGYNSDGMVGWPSRVQVQDGPNFSYDYVTTNLTVSDRGWIDMSGGGLEVRGLLLINDTSALSGDGVVRLTSNAAVALRNNGGIGPGTHGLTITQQGTGRIDLDGTVADDAVISASVYHENGVDFAHLTINGDQLADTYDEGFRIVEGGYITMNMSDGWAMGPASTLVFINNSTFDVISRLNGTALDFSGEISMSGTGAHGQINNPLTLQPAAGAIVGPQDLLEINGATTIEGGTYSIDLDGEFRFDGPTTVLGGTFTTDAAPVVVTPLSFSGATTWNGTVTFNGRASQDADATVTGPTIITAGAFDMDGNSGGANWVIGNSLIINATTVDESQNGNGFDGVMTIAGGFASRLTMNLTTPDYWYSSNVLNLSGVLNLPTTRIEGSPLNVLGTINITGSVQITADTQLGNGAALTFTTPTSELRLSGASTVVNNVVFSGQGSLHNLPSGNMFLYTQSNLSQASLINDGSMFVSNFESYASVHKFTQTATGSWDVQIGGDNPGVLNDVLRVTGAPSTINGVVNVELTENNNVQFLPTIGQTFLFLDTRFGVTGTFTNSPVTITQNGTIVEWSFVYTPTQVFLRAESVTPRCPADFNQDGVVDFFDYLDFVDAFSAESMSADFNHDGVIDFFDYLDFVDAFSAGC